MKKRMTSKIAVTNVFDGLTAEIVAMAVTAGVTTGIIDFLSEDVVPGGTLILIFTFLLGLRLPRLAWLWAVIIGGTVPVVWHVGLSSGFFPADAFASPVAAAIAIGPAIVGAYLGALSRHIGDHLREVAQMKSKR